jgi:hypothetical protein
MGIDIPAKLVSGVAPAHQKGAVLSNWQVEQETGAQRDVGNAQAGRPLGRHEGSLGLQLEIAHGEEPKPYSATPGAPFEVEALLEIAGLSEYTELEGTGLLRCRWGRNRG